MFAAVPGGSDVPAETSGTAAQSPESRRVLDVREVVAQIDVLVTQSWSDHALRPSMDATPGEWCRRLYLDTLGRIPTADEAQAYISLRKPTKRADLVRQLLSDDAHEVDYRRHWTTIWANLLIGRDGGEGTDNSVNRTALEEYLAIALRVNKPYDEMAYELLTATGHNRPTHQPFNGAVNFLVGKLEDDGLQATTQTARLFLGQQLDCVQCHHHPFNEWKQDRFWELNAFFRQTVALRRFDDDSRMVSAVELANQDFGGELGDPSQAVIFFEARNAELRRAFPVFPDGQPLSDRSGYLSAVDRRAELARWIRQSDELSRALVNRMWAHFLGYGLVTPIDDMGPHNPPSHPELLDYLSAQFRASGCDLRQLMTWIVLSKPYALSSRRVPGNAADDPTGGEPPRFSRFYTRPMSAESLYESLLVATHADRTQVSADARDQSRRRWLQQFVLTFGTDEGDSATTFNGTIPQVLMMFNGPMMREATRSDAGSVLDQAMRRGKRPQQLAHLFWCGMARAPVRQELQAFDRLLTAHRGDAAAALQDMWWAVLNSNEFILIH